MSSSSLYLPVVLAGNLTLTSDAPVGRPLVLTSSNSTGELLVMAVNDLDPDAPADFLTAWQLRLAIIPNSTATGSLEFFAGAEPGNYVFEGTGQFGPNISNSGDKLFAVDFNFPDTGGVQIPLAPGANLLSIVFTPSVDALGTFGIFALNGLTNSEWTDATNPIKLRRTFVNVPDGGGPVRIADVLVSHPADFNLDGNVDGNDLAQWQGDFGLNGSSDADGDGNSDGADFLAWQRQFGSEVPTLAASHAVPEPETALLLFLATFTVYLPSRRVPR